MNQPELGLTILKFRKEKGLTQEELAEQAKLNVRTIQRLESGEVMPQPHTLRVLSEILGYNFTVHANQNDRIWILIMHISNFIPLIFPALFIWIWKKDEIVDIQNHGTDILNFQITMFLALFFSGFLILIIIGFPLLIFLAFYISYITLLNTVKVATGKSYRYPLTIKFI